MIDSYMDGKPWKAGKFSLTLRLALWSEHLGLPAREVSTFDSLDSSYFRFLIIMTFNIFSGQSNYGPCC